MITAITHKIQSNKILSYIPMRLRTILEPCVNDKTQEIRLRSGRPLSIRQSGENYFISSDSRLTKSPINAVTVTKNDMENAAGLLCNSSVYAYEEQIKNAFLTTPFGHRVGISGDAVIKDGKIAFINNICGLNYRIAREIKGCAEKLTDDVCTRSSVRNTLIISPPGSGKTTLLRDLARIISNRGKNVGILDERGEIAAMHDTVPGFDIGAFSDVLQGCTKQEGIPLIIRSMSPDVIITDELGGTEDLSAIDDAVCRGVSVIATIHAKSIRDLDQKILKNFNCIIVLSSRLGAGTIEQVMLR